MKTSEPFTAFIIAIFSLASYQDGALWTSGACAGVAVMLLADFYWSLIAARGSQQRANDK